MDPNIVTLTIDDWEIRGKAIPKEPEYRCVTKYWGIYARRFRATTYAYESDGKPVSFLAITYNKLPKGEWGKYINSYLAYTLPDYRRKGYATHLHREVETDAMHRGHARTQSLVKTYAGFRFHLALGHTFWGLNARGEMRCDSPLDRQPPRLRGIPPAAQDAVNAHPLSVPELIAILSTNKLYAEAASPDLPKLFETHPLGYDPAAYRPLNTLC